MDIYNILNSTFNYAKKNWRFVFRGLYNGWSKCFRLSRLRSQKVRSFIFFFESLNELSRILLILRVQFNRKNKYISVENFITTSITFTINTHHTYTQYDVKRNAIYNILRDFTKQITEYIYIYFFFLLRLKKIKQRANYVI